MKILLAVDGSPYTKRMLTYLAAHQELISPTQDMTVITAVTSVPPHVTSYIEKSNLQKYYDEQAEEVLAPVREFAQQHQWSPKFTSGIGSAADVIATAAKEGNFDLVVMGSHGHSGLASLVMGSVTAKVMANCTTPVLVIR